MASYTTNLNLKKPAGSENVAIGDINNNMDTIDQAYGTLNSKVTAQAGTITFESNFDYAGTSDYTSSVYKSGDIVVLNLCFWCNGSFSSGDWVNVCNISAGFRPKNARLIQVIVFEGGHTNGKVYDAKIATNGNINFYPSDITTISGRATINACWTV